MVPKKNSMLICKLRYTDSHENTYRVTNALAKIISTTHWNNNDFYCPLTLHNIGWQLHLQPITTLRAS